MRTISLHFSTAALVACSPSCGTVATRAQGTIFGAYPLMAVWADLAFMERGVGGKTEDMSGTSVNQFWFFLGGLLSLPIDLCIDVVALPIDLGAWAFGNYKDRSVSSVP